MKNQGVEGYSRDPGFDQNTVRDSGKRKYLDGIRDLTATREAGFTKIWTGDAGFCCLSVGNSGNCHDPKNVIAAKANQPGERKISIEGANLHLKFISFCRN